MAYPRGARGFRGGGGHGRIAQRQNWGDYSHLLGPPVDNSWHYHSNRHTDFFGYNPLFAEDAASATPPCGGDLFVEQHQAVQSSVPQQDYGQFYQYNKTATRSPLEEKDFKSLPDEIRNIILNASYRGSLNAQDGFKLRAFYDGLMDSLKTSFYLHLLCYLGQEDADLIANKAEQSRGQAEGNDDDGGVDVEFDFTADSSSSQVPIVASISHKRNRFVKAKGGAGGLKTPMRKENPLDYTKDEIPGVTSDAQGGLTFSKATVRWIRSVLYVLHRSGKGDDVAPAFLAQMSEFFGEECVKQVKDYAHMWRLNQAAQKAAKDTTKVTPEEKARLEQVANLKKIMHHLTFEEVVGLTGQEELRGLSQTTITWIREIVLSILRVKMNPDPFVKRIGDMFGMMAMDRAWANKLYAAQIQKLMAQLRLEEQPRLLQSLAVEAYRKAFNQELPKPEMPAVFREEHGEIAQASGSTSFLGSQLRGPGLLGGVPPTPSGGGSSINSNISTNNRGSYSNSMTFTNVARPHPAAPAYHIPSLLNLRHSAPPGYGPVLGSRTASIRGGYLHPSAPHRYPRARWAGRPY